jgi:hypothetical protein
MKSIEQQRGGPANDRVNSTDTCKNTKKLEQEYVR